MSVAAVGHAMLAAVLAFELPPPALSDGPASAVDRPAPRREGRGLLIAGFAMMGTSALLAAPVVGVIAGIHAENAGPRLQIQHYDPNGARETMEVLKAMEAVGWATAALFFVGTLTATVGAVRLRLGRLRGPHAWRVMPGLGTLTVGGRF